MQRPVRKLVVFCLFVRIKLVQVQSQFSISECQYPEDFIIGHNNKFSLTCTGLGIYSNIYWSISSPYTNGMEIRLGECRECDPNCATTNCTVFNRDYSISRPRSGITILTFVDNLGKNQGALVKCSQFLNQTGAQAFCATRVIDEMRKPEFNIAECKDGTLEIFSNQSTTLTCTGLWPGSNIYWSLRGPSTNGTEIRLGDCPLCYPSCSTSQCYDIDNWYRYPISRPRYDVTILELVTGAQLNDNDALKCSQWNNATTAQFKCAIRFPTATGTPNLSDSSLVPAVIGGVAALLVVVIVIFVVVIVFRRSPCNGAQSSPPSIASESIAHENPIVALESAGITNTGQRGTYDGLEMSDVGQVSHYSVLGSGHHTSYHSAADYEIPGS